MTYSSPAPSTRYYIDLRHGEFAWTTPAQLHDAFAAFKASKKNHLAVFFHGGLVDRGEGLVQAQRLIDGYRKAGAYPFFFIWNSGLLTALEGELLPFADNPVIRRVVERHLLFFTRLFDDTLKLKSPEGDLLRAIGQLPPETPPRWLTLLGAMGRIVDSIWMPRRRDFSLPDPDLSRQSIDAFEKDLENDVAGLGGMLSNSIKFTEAIGSGIMRRLWRRLRSGHDHGLYTSLIEEVGVAIGLDKVLGRLWERMKHDIDQAFQPDPKVYGGTAFLEGFKEVWQPDTRVTLIGHSGGTVYIDRMLNAIDAKLPKDVKADIVFIAAALSFDDFAATIDSGVFYRRVKSHRLFALKDECEGGYWQVPGVYDKSLLYLLSALCEFNADEDKPLVGMQRYWSCMAPYDGKSILTVGATIASNARVWSPSDPHAPRGFRAHAVRHQGFAEEPKTNESVEEFLY